MSSKNQWRALVEQLQPRYRVINIDLLGYGDNRMRRRDTTYCLSDESRHVERILASALAPCETFHLVGHSFGAVVALNLAQRAPHRVDSLTLFDPVAVHMLPPRDPGRLEFETLGAEVEQLYAASDPAAGTGRFIDYWSGAGTFARLAEAKRRAYTALLPKVLLEFRAVIAERRCTSWLREFTAPVCLMLGNSSPAPVRRVAAVLNDLVPRARRIEFCAGHMAPVTHPELVNPEIVQFIANAGPAEDPAEDVEMPTIPQWRTAKWQKSCALALAGLLCTGPATRSTSSQEPVAAASPSTQAWHALPSSLLHGGRYRVVSGDPASDGRFVLRVELEPGFQMSPQVAEHELQFVVLSGDLTLGSGTVEHPAGARTLKSGYFAELGAHQTYYARTQHGATLQIFGTGPVKG